MKNLPLLLFSIFQFFFFTNHASTKNVNSPINKLNCASVSTINPSSCLGIYTSPSGKYSWTSSGTYLDTIQNSAGCDSIITINLTLNSSSTSSQTLGACYAYSSPSGKYSWTSSGTYSDTIPNTANCDSIITINLTIYNGTTSSQTISACNAYSSPSGKYNWTSSGTYFDTIPNAANCDSILTINLTIGKSSSSAQSITTCDSYTSPSGLYTWTASGIYSDTIQNTSGCDSIITTNLTIKYSTSVSQTIAACHYYIAPSGGHIWTSSGTYIDTIQNLAGCDSIITTLLSINDNEYSITQSGCDSLVFNGQKYTTSGTYTQAFTNSASCDSTLFLHLTIYHSSPQTLQQNACDSLVWNGITYFNTGTYIQSFQNASSCDSTVTLVLTIAQSSSSLLSETGCNNYILNGITYTSSGTYTQTLANTAGCDSTITLQLTLKNTSNSITQTSCDSIVINSQKYTASGVYIQTLTNTANCDSTLTLHLTINHGSALNTTNSACKSYFLNGTTFTNSGIYHLPFVNASGCASVLNLNLTIVQPDTSVAQNANVLTSNANSVSYQWLDCSNGNQPISGATSKTYAATTNGNYAVVVSKNSCSDTSACYSVVTIGIHDIITDNEAISIYPNPAKNEFKIQCSGGLFKQVEIYNFLGERCSTPLISSIGATSLIDATELPAGMYLLKIKTGNFTTMRKLLIEK